MPSLLLKKIALMTSEGEIFKVNEALLSVSSTIKELVDEKGIDSVISLPDISSKALSTIIEYLKMHAEFDAAASMTPPMTDDKSVEAWDTQLMNNVEKDTLFEIVLASQYLNIRKLYDVAFETLAEWMVDWTPEEISKTFDLDSV